MQQNDLKYQVCSIQKRDEEFVCLDQDCDLADYIICGRCYNKHHRSHSVETIEELVTQATNNIKLFQTIFEKQFVVTCENFSLFKEKIEQTQKQAIIIFDGIKAAIEQNISQAGQIKDFLNKEERVLVKLTTQVINREEFSKEEMQSIFNLAVFKEEQLKEIIDKSQNDSTVKTINMISDLQKKMEYFLKVDLKDIEMIQDVKYQQLNDKIQLDKQMLDQLERQNSQYSSNQALFCKALLLKNGISYDKIQELKNDLSVQYQNAEKTLSNFITKVKKQGYGGTVKQFIEAYEQQFLYQIDQLKQCSKLQENIGEMQKQVVMEAELKAERLGVDQRGSYYERRK